MNCSLLRRNWSLGLHAFQRVACLMLVAQMTVTGFSEEGSSPTPTPTSDAALAQPVVLANKGQPFWSSITLRQRQEIQANLCRFD